MQIQINLYTLALLFRYDWTQIVQMSQQYVVTMKLIRFTLPIILLFITYMSILLLHLMVSRKSYVTARFRYR